MEESYDCVIVGGGGAGAALAAFLAHSPVKTLVVERRSPDILTKQIIALSYSSLLRLKTVLKDVIPEGLIQTVHVSAQGAFGANRICSRDLQLPYLGWVLPMAVLEGACKEYAKKASNITWEQPAECHGYQLTSNRWQLFSQKKPIDTQLLVAADGAYSSVANAVGVSYADHTYGHPLLLVEVQWAKPHQGIAYERFLQGSTLAVLPLGEKRSICVWSLPPERAELFVKNPELLAHELSVSLGYRLGQAESLERIISFPITQRIAQTSVGARVVLLGNAAHTLHPIGAQGFNLTLRDASMLATELISEKSGRGDVGDPSVLARYQDSRQCDQKKVSLVTHGLAMGVSEKNWSVFSRMFGLQLSRLPLINEAIVQLGLGNAHAKNS